MNIQFYLLQDIDFSKLSKSEKRNFLDKVNFLK